MPSDAERRARLNQGLIRSGRKRTIVGYAWPWTLRPGEVVEFKVSTYVAGPYTADLVRILCGDDLSDAGVFKEREIPASFCGTYPGQFQQIDTGSYVEIAGNPSLAALESFSIQAMVFPTALPNTPAKATWSPLAAPSPNQHLVSRWDCASQCGWALLIDENKCLAFRIGNGRTVHQTTLPGALLEHHWFLVVASYDAHGSEVRISVTPLPKSPCELLTWEPANVAERVPIALAPTQQGPLRFAAAAHGPSNGARSRPVHCFNGRLDRVRLCSGVIDARDARAMSGNDIPDELRRQVVGFWNFGLNIDGVHVHDCSVNGLHGVAVNLPSRGVAGIEWDNSSHDWREHPEHYSAIHFHDDDLYDAEWSTDFTYRIALDLPSGIYAARLRHGASEDYIPFFVAPPKGTATAPLALLLPTTSYTAYSNLCWLNRTFTKRERNELGAWELTDVEAYPCVLRSMEDEEFLDHQLRERRLGKGIYLHHTDGSYCDIASQRYPNIPAKPKGRNWGLVADTYITDWLEQAGIAYDVITDDLLHAEGAELLSNYTVVMTGNHPEYCTARQLDAIAEYQRCGGRWMYLGGNGFFWVTSYHRELPGALEVRKDSMYSGIHPPYEVRHAFDGQAGGLWKHNARPPQHLVGVGSVFPLPFLVSAPYRRLAGSYDPRAAFIFAGVSNETFGNYGIIGGGAAGQETDEIDYQSGTPPHALHLARSSDFPWPMLGHDGLTAPEYRDNVKMPRADIVFFEGPEGGAVFSVGSMAWVGALSHNGYDNDVAHITANVLRRFLDKTPFRLPGQIAPTTTAAESLQDASAEAVDGGQATYLDHNSFATSVS